jgi:hypothetical protein
MAAFLVHVRCTFQWMGCKRGEGGGNVSAGERKWVNVAGVATCSLEGWWSWPAKHDTSMVNIPSDAAVCGGTSSSISGTGAAPPLLFFARSLCSDTSSICD